MLHRIELNSAYILHTRPYSDTSLIVELFSRSHGRVTVIARSARGPKSRYRGQLQLFTPIQASWVGLRELKTLTQVELQGMPLQLNQHPLFCGFYCNELLMRLLHKEDPHPVLFDSYHDCLRQLENHVMDEMSLGVILRLFEKKLLQELGYGLPLTIETKTGDKIKSDAYYHFIPRQGFCFADPNHHDQQSFLGSDLIGMREEKFHIASVFLAAKKIMSFAIADLLGHKPLQSRLFF